MPKSHAVPSHSQRSIGALVYDGLCTFEFGVVAEIFGLPRPEMGKDWYQFSTAAAHSGVLRAHGGLRFHAEADLQALDGMDTIVIPGWCGIDTPVPGNLKEALCRAHARGARLISICSGAFVLAATGLLDGRRATTHWRYAEALKTRFPSISVDADVLYVDDAPLFTSAGSAAGIDLLLHIVRQDYGPDKANSVARRLVMAPHRQGGQAQFIERAVVRTNESRLAGLLESMQSKLARQYRNSDLAEMAGMSERTFLRRFVDASGTTPAEWLVSARIDAAKQLLEKGTATIQQVADASGFGTVETLRYHFRRRMGLSPGGYREGFLVRNVGLPF